MSKEIQVKPGDVKKLVDMLRDEVNRSKAANELSRLSFRTRGASVSTRGTLQKSAESRAEGVDFAPAFEALKDQRPEVRSEVAYVLGELADALAIEILTTLVTDRLDPDANVRSAVVEALGKIGGPQVIKVIEQVAKKDPNEKVRVKVIGALSTLAIQEYRNSVGTETEVSPRSLRTRGAVRTRGGSPIRELSPEARGILELIHQLRENDPSDYVQDIADLTLRQLGD